MNFNRHVLGTQTQTASFSLYAPACDLDSEYRSWFSEELTDPGWDEFLTSTPLGQFQQSTLWASGKCDGTWQVLRVIFTSRGRGVGGFQLFYRRTPTGLIGYVSKGPVIVEESKANWDVILHAIKTIARQRRFRALIVQPPDTSSVDPTWILDHGFLPEKLQGVVDATLWFDLAGTPDDIMKKMPGYNRTFIRQAMRKGVTVREGGTSDTPLFFDLMTTTCKRQAVTPNPRSLEDVQRIWQAFHRKNAMRIVFAEHEGKTLATLASFVFGNRVTLWKKGWTSSDDHLRPNHLLYYDTLCWAQRTDAQFCDFYATRRDIVEALLRGDALTAEQSKSRDRFHLGFGGKPTLLPPAFIFFPSKVLCLAYRLVSRVIPRSKPQ
jgi:lipid II:glycine glycyltransferase (peptidoglycan interpeptide bridge formation enzyme)